MEGELERSLPVRSLDDHGHGDALDKGICTGEVNAQPFLTTNHTHISAPVMLNSVLVDKVRLICLEIQRLLLLLLIYFYFVLNLI